MPIEMEIKHFFERFGVPIDRDFSEPKFFIPAILSSLSGLALFIIACIGAAGHFPGPALAGSVIGLSAAGFIFHLMTTDIKKYKTATIIQAAVTAVFILLGACGLTNFLYPVGVGTMVIIARLLTPALFFFDSPCSSNDAQKSDPVEKTILLREVEEPTEEQLGHAQPAPMPKFQTAKNRLLA